MLERLRSIGIETNEETGRVTALPAASNEVAALLSCARDEGWIVAPSWADTGRLPAESVLLSIEKLSSIDEVLPDDLMAVAGAGVTNAALRERVSSDGLFWPPGEFLGPDDLVGDAMARLPGGWTMLGGLARRYLLALEAILPDGNTLRAGARTVKSVTGYDLKQLFVGSRATLGIISSLTIRLEAEANRDLVLERYRRDYAGIDVDGSVRDSDAVCVRESASVLTGRRSGSMVILERLKREFDPDGVLPSVEAMFAEGVSDDRAR